jgi:hypothetical protein
VEAFERRLTAALASAWRRGWEPVALDRHLTRRERSTGLGPLLRAAMAVEAVGYAQLGGRVAPAWMDQLEALGVVPDERAFTRALDEGSLGPEDGATIGQSLFLLLHLAALAPLPKLCDPPSAWRDRLEDAGSGPDVPASLLSRIRALLAKAESTTFSAEAEAFMAKAQELMARHRVDRALLEEEQHGERLADGVVGRRISVDDPYATAKFHLLAGLAGVNGARAIWSKSLGMATVFGFPVEVDVVEELFTSLLVQATAAMQREGPKVDAVGRSRTKAFRRSFLLAFGARVEQRLREAVARVVADASTETGTDLVPVLAEREAAVDIKVDELFPRLGSMSASVSDTEGLFAGRLAADRADLSAGPHLDRRSA